MHGFGFARASKAARPRTLASPLGAATPQVSAPHALAAAARPSLETPEGTIAERGDPRWRSWG
eukprot:8804318-Lingulodinium_polyedra.AAC.1